MRVKQFLSDILYIFIGTGLYAVALTAFLSPNQISPGGLTGLASIITYATSLPTGILIIALNLPLFILAFKHSGKEFLIKTLLTTLWLSLVIDILSVFMPVYTGDKILSALYGGAISGIGFAIIFWRGSSTGGADIIAKIVSKKHPTFSMGTVIFMSDALVIIAAAIAYRSFDTALYTFLTIIIMSFVIDHFIYGSDSGKMILIITNKQDDIRQSIITRLQRGATIIKSIGAYSQKDTNVIICAVRINEVSTLNRIVLESDPNAFMITANASQIHGKGFTKNEEL